MVKYILTLNHSNMHSLLHTGTTDEKARMHFLEGALTVMQGKTYIPGIKSNHSSNTSFLPSIADADSHTTVKDVAVDLPRNRQQELLGKLKLIEEKIGTSSNPLAKDMRIPKKAKAPQKRFGAPQEEKSTLMVAIGHLSRARQIQLLGSLRNLEDRLKLSTAQTLVGLESGFEKVEAMPAPQPTVEKVLINGPYGPEIWDLMIPWCFQPFCPPWLREGGRKI